MRHTRSLMRPARRQGVDTLTLDVWGQWKAEAYMKVGWTPLSMQTSREQVGHIVADVDKYILTIDVWDRS